MKNSTIKTTADLRLGDIFCRRSNLGNTFLKVINLEGTGERDAANNDMYHIDTVPCTEEGEILSEDQKQLKHGRELLSNEVTVIGNDTTSLPSYTYNPGRALLN